MKLPISCENVHCYLYNVWFCPRYFRSLILNPVEAILSINKLICLNHVMWFFFESSYQVRGYTIKCTMRLFGQRKVCTNIAFPVECLNSPVRSSILIKVMPAQAQSVSPLAPIGVNAALDPSVQPRPKIFDEFALTDRVGIVSGGNRGIGLEMALTLCELGARVVYCLDLPETPSEEWQKTKEYVVKLGNNSRLEYISVDVTDQDKVWKIGEDIGNKEKRMDVCVAAAGIVKGHTDCLEYPAKQFQEAGYNHVCSESPLMMLIGYQREC